MQYIGSSSRTRTYPTALFPQPCEQSQQVISVPSSWEVRAGSGVNQLSNQRVQGIISPVVKRLGREAIRSPYLVLRLRMSGAVPLLPLYAFVEWTGTTKGQNSSRE